MLFDVTDIRIPRPQGIDTASRMRESPRGGARDIRRSRAFGLDHRLATVRAVIVRASFWKREFQVEFPDPAAVSARLTVRASWVVL